ncbi:hypothetical protein [Burkholderia cenocepacia]|uniref:hypothetical protein n=1 Tax=Burkholderia cenocepacia TaxID=95486 RepID=UPI000AF66FFB|nr:hypothetical protein [Burkholderia cenocepacia]MBR7981122.1 hypothetical protein [Burkholderia cenocepacia]
MNRVFLQQYYEAEDEAYPLGAPSEYEVTDEELEEFVNGITWSERLNGLFAAVIE